MVVSFRYSCLTSQPTIFSHIVMKQPGHGHYQYFWRVNIHNMAPRVRIYPNDLFLWSLEASPLDHHVPHRANCYLFLVSIDAINVNLGNNQPHGFRSGCSCF